MRVNQMNSKVEINSKEELEMKVIEVFDSIDFISPYKLHSVVNLFVDDKIKPQMMYNYVRNNLIKVTKNSTDKIEVSKEEGIRFVVKFVSNRNKLN